MGGIVFFFLASGLYGSAFSWFLWYRGAVDLNVVFISIFFIDALFTTDVVTLYFSLCYQSSAFFFTHSLFRGGFLVFRGAHIFMHSPGRVSAGASSVEPIARIHAYRT